MVVGESVARSSRSLKRGYGGEAKGICTAPTRGRCEPLRCPSVDRGERGNKVRNHVATRVVLWHIMAMTEPIKTFT